MLNLYIKIVRAKPSGSFVAIGHGAEERWEQLTNAVGEGQSFRWESHACVLAPAFEEALNAAGYRIHIWEEDLDTWYLLPKARNVQSQGLEFHYNNDGRGYQLRLEHGQLTAYANYPTKTEVAPVRNLRPTPEQWECFWAEVTAAGVWAWKAEYDSMILDGTQWSLSFQHAGRRVESHGNNAYPNSRGNSYRRGSSFDRVERAVRSLAGLPDWQD